MRFAQTSVYKSELVGAKFFTNPNGEFALVAEEQRTEDAITSARRMKADLMMSPETVLWRKFHQMTTRGVVRKDAEQLARKIRADLLMSPEAVFWRKFRQMTTRGVVRKVAKFSTQEEASTFAEAHTDTYIFPYKFVRNFHTVDENGKNVYSSTYYYKVLYR